MIGQIIYCNDYILDQSKVNFIQAVSSVPLSPGPQLDVGHTLCWKLEL